MTLQMAGQWLLLDVQGLGLRLAWDLQVVTSRVGHLVITDNAKVDRDHLDT